MESSAKRARALASTAKQLRGWVGSDPSKEPAFIDALNDLTEHRLVTRTASEGVADAQEAFTRAFRAAPAPGTLGPLTKTDVIARQVRAMAHLAMVQVAAGQHEAAAQTALAALAVRAELGRPELDAALAPAAKVWLLTAVARGAAASGDLGRANAYADAALARTWDEAFTASELVAPVGIEARALVADHRWAAGVVGDALAHGRAARDAARARADEALAAANQVSPADLLAAVVPAVTTWRDLADRLAAAGDVGAAVAERRMLVAWLEALTGRAKADQRATLGWARADLAHDLLRAGDVAGARDAAQQAVDWVPTVARSDAPGALPLHLVAGATLASAALREGDLDAAAAALGGALEAYERAGRPAAAGVAYALALLARADVEDAHDLAEDAAATRAEFAALAASLRAGLPAPHLYADVPAADLVRDQARGVVTRSPLPTPHWDNLPPTEALGASFTGGSAEAIIPSATVVEPQPEPAVEPEPEPAVEPQPEPAVEPEPEPAVEPQVEPVVEPQPEPVVEPQPEPVVEPQPEPVVEPEPEPEVEPQPEPVVEPRPEAVVEPQPEPEVEPEPAPPLDPAASARDLLTAGRAAEAEETALAALQVYRPTIEVVALLKVIADARAARGDRKGVPAIANQIVEQLRPLADADPATHGPDLVAALQALSEARKAAGDWWGSLGPGREAKQLAKRLGR